MPAIDLRGTMRCSRSSGKAGLESRPATSHPARADKIHHGSELGQLGTARNQQAFNGADGTAGSTGFTNAAGAAGAAEARGASGPWAPQGAAGRWTFRARWGAGATGPADANSSSTGTGLGGPDGLIEGPVGPAFLSVKKLDRLAGKRRTLQPGSASSCRPA